MPYDSDEIHASLAALEELRKNYSPLWASAGGTVQAAVWLIAGGRSAQAVSLLHNAIELAFKGELDRIHRALIADARKWGYSDLKAILRESFLAHPQGAKVKLPEFDFDKTITFLEALDRVKDLYPALLAKWEKPLRALHDHRNDIVHSGHTAASRNVYAHDLVLTGFPFFEEFLEAATNVRFGQMVMTRTARELQIARTAAGDQLAANGVVQSNVLTTVNVLSLHNASIAPELVDKDGFILSDLDLNHDLAEQARSEFEKEGNNVDLEATCHICDSYPMFVCLDTFDDGDRVRAVALSCYRCGLRLSDQHGSLVHHHFGKISDEDRDRYLKDIGESC